MTRTKITEIIKKIPLFGAATKIFYDYQREKHLMSKIDNFLKHDRLPFDTIAPPNYSIGHEPTIRCNLRCKMCYQGQSRALRKSELNTNEMSKINECLKNKITSIKLVGGEPFVRSDILDIISFWDHNNKKIFLQTNCTLLNEENIQTLKRFRNIAGILTSLDGTPTLHDQIRGVSGTFAKLQKAISLLQKYMPATPISIFAVLLLSDNLDTFPALIDTCKMLGISSLNVLFEQVYSSEEVADAHTIFQKKLGWQSASYRVNTQLRNPVFSHAISTKELKSCLSRIRRYGMKKGCFINFTPFNFYSNLDKYFGTTPGRTFCLKLLEPELRINQNGDVLWCDVIEKPFGSLLEKTPDEIWLSEELQAFRRYLLRFSLPICHRCCKSVFVS